MKTSVSVDRDTRLGTLRTETYVGAIDETVPMATDWQRSIDHSASPQEWDLLLQWMVETSLTVMASNNNQNPWLKPVPKVPKEEQKKLLPSTGYYSDTRAEEILEG